MAVLIVEDLGGLLDDADYGIIIASVSAYVTAVQRLKREAQQPGKLRILVREPACSVWLSRMAATYPANQVTYSRASARELLAHTWQTTIPASVLDEDILASSLIDTDVVPRAGQPYEEIILEHFWGEFFTFVRLPIAHIADLLESIDLDRWSANQTRPLVMKVLQDRKAQWMTRATTKALRELTEAIFDDPAALRTRLGQYKLVRRYPPSVGEAVLGDWYEVFRSAQVSPDAIDLGQLNTGVAVQETLYYLNAVKPSLKTMDDLRRLLDQMSGCLRQEFDWLRDTLADHADEWEVAPSFVEAVAALFQPIAAEIGEQIAALQALIPPPYPRDPTGLSKAEAWLDWAVQSYLPYRFWLEENDRWDDEVATYAGAYADWFYAHYTDLKYQEQRRWVFDLMGRILLRLKQGQKVLLIIVDCLSFKYAGYLRDQFAAQGYHTLGSVEPVWSVIPTTTEVSKHCLVAGEREPVEVKGASYEDILRKDWKDYFGSYTVAYTSLLDDLRNRDDISGDMVVLNYLPVDVTLHQDERQVGGPHTPEIRGRLRRLVEVVMQFAKRSGSEQELVIAIASDHGATKVLPEREDLLDDKFYRKQAIDRHHRYISVPSTRAANPTDYDKAHCYILPAGAFGTRDSYFVARGYGLFVKTSERIYAHGGLTPEETIVPFMELTKSEIQVRQPTFRLPDNVIRYSVRQSLTVVIGNPNDDDIRITELAIVESEITGLSPGNMTAGTAAEIEMPVRIRRRGPGEDLTSITLRGTFEMRGRAYPIEAVTLPVEVRSLMESKTDFDFEF